MHRLSGNRLASLRARHPESSPSDSHFLRQGGEIRCVDCDAVQQAGRWQWRTPAAAATPGRCPACCRIRDRFAAHVLRFHHLPVDVRGELKAMVARIAAAETRTHPLERLMLLRDRQGHLEVATTGVHLARLLLAASLRAFRRHFAVRHGSEFTDLLWRDERSA